MERSLAARLLEAGVPLTLLLDLVCPDGPDSREILRVEGIARDLLLEAERMRQARAADLEAG